MKKVDNPRRINTEPNHSSIYQTSIRAQGTIWVQDSPTKPKRSDILTVKPNNKVQYHCFKRYKSFPFSFDHVYDECTSQSVYEGAFSPGNASEALGMNHDYMLFCCGSLLYGEKELGTQVYSLFYDSLETTFNDWVKQSQFTMRLHAIAVGQDLVYDLISDKQVQIREIAGKKAHSSEVHFVGIQYQEADTLYQIYDLIKSSTSKKARILDSSYYVLYCELTPDKGNAKRRRMVFVDSTKSLAGGDSKSWDSNSVLVLNKCILGLYNRMENQQSYCPFRDSKITRVMKPFLSFNSRIDALGFVNRDDDEFALATLNLIKNLSRLKIEAEFTETQNPEVPEKVELLTMENERIREELNTLKNESQIKSEPRLNLLEEIRKNALGEREMVKSLENARRKAKLIKTKKWLNKLGLGLVEETPMLSSLQEDELEYEERVEKKCLEDIQKLNDEKVQTIEKSISRVEKLKLMKEYFTMALHSQEDEAKKFMQNQKVFKQLYEKNIKAIEMNLKKSPRQHLKQAALFAEQRHASGAQTPKKKRNSSYDVGEKLKLPGLDRMARRKTLVKNKVMRGRVEYESFLSKNIENYQSYETPKISRK